MRILFLSSRNISTKSQGAPLCTNRNYESFSKIVGKKNVDVFLLTNEDIGWRKWIYLFYGFYWGLTKKRREQILSIAQKYDVIFIDSSFHGILARDLKLNGYNGKIICHFHNIEVELRKQKARRMPWRAWEIPLVKFNENMAIKYADVEVVLNKRDRELLVKIYGAKSVHIIPISMKDIGYDKVIPVDDSINKPPVFLFVGGNHYANYDGIIWFIKNVLPKVFIKLIIVGKGMDVLKKKYSSSMVEIHGYVEDLTKFWLESDFFLSPIFKGGGMKVKTCEALMFGKNIIGTKESFEGYDVNFQKTGAVCSSREDFINTIKNINKRFYKKFNEYNRKVYEKKYSFNATLRKFKNLL